MNFFLNVLWQHASTAVLKNWGYTLAGLIVAILQAGPTLSQYFQGTDVQHVDYSNLWKALLPLIMGALGKSGINLWSLLTGFTNSAPRAEPVKK